MISVRVIILVKLNVYQKKGVAKKKINLKIINGVATNLIVLLIRFLGHDIIMFLLNFPSSELSFHLYNKRIM